MKSTQPAIIPPDEPPDEALAALISEHGAFVYAVCLGMCGDEERARDLAQETFLRAYRSWHRFEGRSKPSTWLYTIARRTCLRLMRTRAGEPPRLDHLEPLRDRVPATSAVPEVDYARTDALEDLIREETAALVRRAIAHLPIRYRLPLVLKEMADLSVAEVAEVLHLSEGTVKSRMFRARAELAPELEPVAPSAAPDGEAGSEAEGEPDADPGRVSGDSGVRRSRAETLCPYCREVFGTEERASLACEEILEGEVPAEVRTMLRREPASR